MERGLAKLIVELKTRPATPEEVKVLVDTLLAQEKQAKVAALVAQIRRLRSE